jgi:hypothetical protein
MAPPDEIAVFAGIDNGAVLNHQDAIRPKDGRWAVGHYD